MKRNIEVIHVKMSLIEWMVDLLKKRNDRPEGAEELIQGLLAMLGDENSSLMIEQGDSHAYDTENRRIRCGALTMDISSRRVIRDGKDISLTPKEFDILYFLAKNRGEVFTKEQIYQAVWDDQYLLDDSNIMAFIRKIRKKIEPNPDSPQYILTIWGIGYKFNEKLS